MAPTRFYNCSASYGDPALCETMLGDNSNCGGANPWAGGVRIVDFRATETDEETQKAIYRFYTIRPAKFPQDRHAVKNVLSEQIANLEMVPQQSVDRMIETEAEVSVILLVCGILVDGVYHIHDTLAQRMARTPEHLRHAIPLSSDSNAAPDPGHKFSVKSRDIPQPVLQERIVGLLSVQPSKFDSQVGDMTLSTENSFQGQTEHQRRNKYAFACDLKRLYVMHGHHQCLAYALVDTFIVYARGSGYTTMILSPAAQRDLELAKEIFEKAGPDPSDTLALSAKYKSTHGKSLKSPNHSAVKITTRKDNDGKDAAVFEMILADWPGPLDRDTLAKIWRRKRQQGEEERDIAGRPSTAVNSKIRSGDWRVEYVDSSTSPYEYESLDEGAHEVRILTLLPGPRDAKIRISLNNHELYQTDKSNKSRILVYEALSYSWGSTDNLGHVFIDNREQPLPVTRSLADALLHLRYPDKPRRLWIDAICVNQADLQERGSQINRMAGIYKNAERVVVWLGPGTSQSTEAMKILSWIGRTVDVDWFHHKISGHHDPLPESLNEVYMHDCANLSLSFPFNNAELECLTNVLSRSWFERLWIWQEIRLAPDLKSIVQCGSHSMSWGDFSKAIFLLRHKDLSPRSQELAPSLSSRIRLAYRVCDIGNEQVLDLLEMTRLSKCSDPKDRIYALLAIFEEANNGLMIKPDYTIPLYEVYREATLRLLLDLGKLEILAGTEMQEEEETPTRRGLKYLTTKLLGETERRRKARRTGKDEPEAMLNWSTWVPDWSRPRCTWPIFNAFAAHISHAEISHHGVAIHIAGIAVTEIHDLRAFDPKGLDVSKLSEYPAGAKRNMFLELTLINILLPFLQGRALTSEALFSFSRTTVAGVDINSFDNAKGWRSVSWMAMALSLGRALAGIQKGSFVNHTETDFDGVEPAIPDEQMNLLFTQVLTRCEGRSIFRAQDGNFGLVPCAARKGDIVVVFLGCDNPLVLRPTGSHYKIVGEAYFDGFMEGEALLGPLPILSEPNIEYATASSLFRQNLKDGDARLKDPRLGDLPPGWTSFKDKDKDIEKTYFTNKNVDDGAVTPHDPRLRSSWLREQGVNIQTFEVI